jgi:ribose transport system ATP-binding protein
MSEKVIFRTEELCKNYGPTIALKNVDIEIRQGEIRGLVGENGSGKSTIMSIASGMQKQSNGRMYFKDKEWNPDSMIEAAKEGIAMILQEANIIPHVSVAENIFAGREKEFSKFGIINVKKMNKAANALLRSYQIDHIDASVNIDRYSFEDGKLIEIVRAMSENPEILVVDETTTALSLEGRKILYRLIREMANCQKSVVLISHDMEEIIEQCDALTVLRDGDIIGHLDQKEIASVSVEKKIRYMMVGREIGDKYYREDYDVSHQEEVALELKNVSSGSIKDFSLKLHKGQIIGIGGLSGSGMHQIGRIAYGLEPLEHGSVQSGAVEIKTCLNAIENGIGYISKNRDTEALILEGSIKDNICLPLLNSMEEATFISPRKEKSMSNREIESFSIKCNSSQQWVNTLSGGNKQKVSFAKWTAKGSDIIIMDSPTRGVDIGVKQAMYQLIEKMKEEGKAILMISEELSELIGMSDELIIMKKFKVSKVFQRSPDLKETDIIEYMI